MSRINAYRALSSPSLIALSSTDPILSAFELSVELKRLAYLETEFRQEYMVRNLFIMNVDLSVQFDRIGDV